jgi:hypothetical protein
VAHVAVMYWWACETYRIVWIVSGPLGCRGGVHSSLLGI